MILSSQLNDFARGLEYSIGVPKINSKCSYKKIYIRNFMNNMKSKSKTSSKSTNC